MSITPEKSLSSFSIPSHGPCYSLHFCHPRPTGQLPNNALEKPRKLCSNRKYFYQTHVSKHESHTIYTTGDSCDDLVGGPTVRKFNEKNKTREFCKKIKCTRTTESYSKDDQSLCAFWHLFSEYLRKMYQFYWSIITIRCPVRRTTKLCELSCEMRGVLYCMKRDFNIYLRNAICMPKKKGNEVKHKKEKTDKKEHTIKNEMAKIDKQDEHDEKSNDKNVKKGKNDAKIIIYKKEKKDKGKSDKKGKVAMDIHIVAKSGKAAKDGNSNAECRTCD